ncbi:MAG: Fic family protein [Bryobacterales bacterium]|nr:Fic family protein [Bryobacterales bacterium]
MRDLRGAAQAARAAPGSPKAILQELPEQGLLLEQRAADMTGKDPAKWAPLEGMPEGAHGWVLPGLAEMEQEWQGIRNALAGRDRPRRFLDNWLEERGRAFAIENGQIENLYTLRRGVTEELMAEGLQGVIGAHTLEGLPDRTIQGLLQDQAEALEVMFRDVADGQPLTQYTIRSWHAMLTRNQETVTGLQIAPDGKAMRRVQIPFREKGVWKRIPNNPRRTDGRVHEYCPPEQVQSEMDRFIELHREIEAKGYPVQVEAAWMHHRFVRTHPFRDGNGRVSRMLMAYAYTKRWLPPPIVSARRKPDYIDVLEDADSGDLKTFSDYLGDLARIELRGCIRVGRRALAGHLERPNGNGGRTYVDQYVPPLRDGDLVPLPSTRDRGGRGR